MLAATRAQRALRPRPRGRGRGLPAASEFMFAAARAQRERAALLAERSGPGEVPHDLLCARAASLHAFPFHVNC
eukprot:tig00020934_g16077.t1